MNVVMNTLMTSTDGISDSLHGIGDYPKAKLSFKSTSSNLNNFISSFIFSSLLGI